MPKMKTIKPSKNTANAKLKVAKQKWQQAKQKVVAITKKGKQQLKTFKIKLDTQIQKQQAKADALLKTLEQLQKPAADLVDNKGKKSKTKKVATPKMAKSKKKVTRKKASAKKRTA